MKIISVDERTVPLTSDTSNAGISFSSMTASAVVIEIETAAGRFKGLGFSSMVVTAMVVCLRRGLFHGC